MSRRPLFAVTVIILLLALVPAGMAADPAALELLMPEARVVAGLDMARLMSSPLGDILRTGVQSGFRQAAGGAQLAGLFAQLGFDPFQDVQQVLLATTGVGKNPPSLVVIRGSDRLRAMMQSQVGRTRSTGNSVAILGDLILTGDAAQVRAAKLRQGQGSALSARMAKRVADMSAKYDVWVISTAPVSSLAANVNDPKARAFGNMEALRSIEQFSFGLGMSADFVLNVEVVAHDAKSAAALADSARLLLAMAQQNAAKDPATAEALKKLDFAVQGRVLRIGMTVPAEEVRKQIETLRAQAPGGALAPGDITVQGAGATSPAPKASRVPPNADIVIHSSSKDMGTVVISGSKK